MTCNNWITVSQYFRNLVTRNTVSFQNTGIPVPDFGCINVTDKFSFLLISLSSKLTWHGTLCILFPIHWPEQPSDIGPITNLLVELATSFKTTFKGCVNGIIISWIFVLRVFSVFMQNRRMWFPLIFLFQSRTKHHVHKNELFNRKNGTNYHHSQKVESLNYL